jgi:hypothetical protein
MPGGYWGLSRWSLVLMLLVVAAGTAAAEEKVQVRVCIISIIATERDAEVGRKLECIAKEVQKVNPKLTGFKVKNFSCKSVNVGGKDTFELVEDQSTVVTLEPPTEKDKPYRIRLAPPMMGEITYTSTCGKFLPIMTPYRTKDNDVLIIAVRVSPCQGK